MNFTHKNHKYMQMSIPESRLKLQTRDDMFYIDRPREENDFMYEMGCVDASCNGVSVYMNVDDFKWFKKFIKKALRKDTKTTIDDHVVQIIYLGSQVLFIVKYGDKITSDEWFTGKFDKDRFCSFLNQILALE